MLSASLNKTFPAFLNFLLYFGLEKYLAHNQKNKCRHHFWCPDSSDRSVLLFLFKYQVSLTLYIFNMTLLLKMTVLYISTWIKMINAWYIFNLWSMLVVCVSLIKKLLTCQGFWYTHCLKIKPGWFKYPNFWYTWIFVIWRYLKHWR